MLLFGDPSVDLWITIVLLGISLFVSLLVLFFAKRKILAILVFSVLGNLSFLLNIGSEMFRIYHIKWLALFSLLIWPILNIFFIFRYFQTKPGRK
jgi:hypothetical protein